MVIISQQGFVFILFFYGYIDFISCIDGIIHQTIEINPHSSGYFADVQDNILEAEAVATLFQYRWTN